MTSDGFTTTFSTQHEALRHLGRFWDGVRLATGDVVHLETVLRVPDRDLCPVSVQFDRIVIHKPTGDRELQLVGID